MKRSKHIAGSAWGGPVNQSMDAATQQAPSTWRPVTRWQAMSWREWRWWLGKRWKLPDYIEGGYTHKTNRQRAKQVLEEQFNASQQSGVNGPQRRGGLASGLAKSRN